MINELWTCTIKNNFLCSGEFGFRKLPYPVFDRSIKISAAFSTGIYGSYIRPKLTTVKIFSELQGKNTDSNMIVQKNLKGIPNIK